MGWFDGKVPLGLAIVRPFVNVRGYASGHREARSAVTVGHLRLSSIAALEHLDVAWSQGHLRWPTNIRLRADVPTLGRDNCWASPSFEERYDSDKYLPSVRRWCGRHARGVLRQHPDDARRRRWFHRVPLPGTGARPDRGNLPARVPRGHGDSRN